MHEQAARPNLKLRFVIVALCFLSQVMVALVHQEKPAAASRVLLLFNCAVGAVFWLGLR